MGVSEASSIRFTSSDALSTTAVTVEAWIKLDPTSTTEATVFQAEQRYTMAVEPAGPLRCGTLGGLARGGVVALDKWVHVACVFGAGEAKAYVDGAVRATSPFTGFPIPSLAAAAIGDDVSGGKPVFGLIDTLRVFSVVRTGAEIAAAAKL